MKLYTSMALAALLQLPLQAVTLDEAVDKTLATNPQMQKSVSDYIAIKNDLDIAKSGWRPTVDFSLGIGPEKTERKGTVFGSDSANLTRRDSQLIARQNLFEGFGTENDIKEQEARVNASRYTALQDANTIGLRTTEVYLQVIRQKKILDLLMDNVKTHERIYKMIKQKTESGLSRRSDLEQTQGRLALAYANYISQQNNYQDALTNFERIYGQLVIASEMEEPGLAPLPAMDVPSLIELAQNYSPTLTVQKSNLTTQESRLEKERKGFYPKLDLELAGSWNENQSGQEQEYNAYSAMLRLNYNLYAGGNDESTRLKNLQLVTSEKESLNEQERAVIEKIRLALMAEYILENQIKCLDVHTKQTRQTANSYAKEYQLGRRTLLDLLNTELEYNSAKQAVENARFDRLFARYRVLEAAGVLPYAFENNVLTRVEAPVVELYATAEDANITAEDANVTIAADNNTSSNQNVTVELRGETDQFLDIGASCSKI